jgi:hypothetical protein
MAERSPAASEEEMSEDEVAAAENVGLITVHIGEKECEITTLDSLDESIGGHDANCIAWKSRLWTLAAGIHGRA